MALFKVFKGNSSNLPTLSTSQDGWCYFTTDDGKFYIDYDDNGTLRRKQINSAGQNIEYIEGTQTATTASWTGVTKDPALYDGKIILYKLSATSASNVTLNLTFTNPIGDATSGAIPVYLNDNSRVTTHWPKNGVILMVYDSNDSRWRAQAEWNTTYSAMSQSEAWTGTATSSRVVTAAGLKSIFANLGGTGLDLVHDATNGIVLNHSNSVTANASYPTGTAASANGGKITVRDIKYDAQGHITGSQDREITLSQTTYTVGNKALKVASNSGTAMQAITVNENSSDRTLTVSGDGTYITGAVSGSSNAATITLSHTTPSGLTTGSYGNSSNQTPGYGSTFNVPYITVDAGGHITAISNKTVKIPASDNTNTASAVDNILDGSNSGTAITYAPYTSQQSKLSFDTSAAFPTRTDRLNLNGALYATKFQAEHLKNDAGEYRVTYGDTINMWLGVGNGNTNHGLYDSIASKWMIVADNSGNVTVNGNASTARAFSSAAAVTLTGDITGTASSIKGWSIATTIGNGKVTNAMLAGSIANSKLTNSKVTIAGNDVSLGGSLAADTLRTSLGLSSAMHFIGLSEDKDLEDGWTGTPEITSGVTYSTKQAGDVVLRTDTNEEFVWSGNYWELLGRNTSFKVVQTPVTTATKETGTATTFVHSVTQDANGNITVKTKDLPTYNNYSLPVAKYNVLGGLKPAYTTTGAASGFTAATNTSTPALSSRTTTAGRYYAIEADKNGVPFVNVPWTDTNKYHKTGSWSGLTYTATAVNSADELKFTIPTASTSTAGAMTTDMVTKLNGIQESADAVSFTRSLTSGTKVGTITINGTGTDIYAPTNTDTKNTTGSTDTSNKIFLIGATEQSANPQTYSDDQVFTTSGVLTAKELVLSQTGARSITFSRTNGYNYIQTPAGGGVAICATDNSVSLVSSTLLVNATNVRPGQTNTYDLGTSSNKWKAAYVATLNSDDIIVDNLTASQAVSTDTNKKLVSTNLTVSDPTASGTGITYIATISQSAVGKITVTKSTVRSASTSQTGVVQLSSATNNTSETLAATAKAVKTAYDLANTANTTANSHKYWANIESTSAAAYNKTPEVASIKINGDTSASAASTKNVQLTYDSTDDSINFNFI